MIFGSVFDQDQWLWAFHDPFPQSWFRGRPKTRLNPWASAEVASKPCPRPRITVREDPGTDLKPLIRFPHWEHTPCRMEGAADNVGHGVEAPKDAVFWFAFFH